MTTETTRDSTVGGELPTLRSSFNIPVSDRWKAVREFGAVDAVVVAQLSVVFFLVVTSLISAVVGTSEASGLFCAGLLLLLPLIPVLVMGKVDNSKVESTFVYVTVGSTLLNFGCALMLLIFSEAPRSRLFLLFCIAILQFTSKIFVSLSTSQSEHLNDGNSWFRRLIRTRQVDKPTKKVEQKTPKIAQNLTSSETAVEMPLGVRELKNGKSRVPVRRTSHVFGDDVDEYKLSVTSSSIIEYPRVQEHSLTSSGKLASDPSYRNVSKANEKSMVKTAIPASNKSSVYFIQM